MLDPLKIGKVKFDVRADDTLRAELRLQTEAAGVEWDEARRIIEVEAERMSKAATQSILKYMADSWTPQQWQAAAEIYGSHNQCSDEQGDGGASAPRDSMGKAR